MTDKPEGETREQEHTVEIDAPPSAVWAAITESDEVIRWYVQTADIDACVGGAYRISWGEGMEGDGKIVIFEPEKRMRMEYQPVEGSPPLGEAIAEEYFIETKGGKTVLRMVQSGIPDTPDWDWFYEGTKRGWEGFFLTLRHYLEKHAGTPRDHIVMHVAISETDTTAWNKLIGPDGLGMTGDERAGGRFSARCVSGDELVGDVLVADPPNRLLVTVEGMNDAMLGAAIEQMGPSNFLYLSLSTFGLDPAVVEDVRARWTAWPAALFPVTSDPAAAYQDMVDGLQDAVAEAPPEA
ncbi:MAG: SRPBCC domain-containing protein [Gemmatimonadetes bacterium]|nr:SRPBCC domain-containing protein [Gemmatimonadota bacterium]